MRLFGMQPKNWNEYKEDTQSIDVAIGLIAKTITESTRNGVLLALNDAFGDKK